MKRLFSTVCALAIVLVMAGMVKEVPMTEVYSGIWPFALGMAILVGFIIIFPDLALYLPRVMM